MREQEWISLRGIASSSSSNHSAKPHSESLSSFRDSDAGKKGCDLSRRPGCTAPIGGFAALVDLKAAGVSKEEISLLLATDGVGTKLKVITALFAELQR